MTKKLRATATLLSLGLMLPTVSACGLMKSDEVPNADRPTLAAVCQGWYAYRLTGGVHGPEAFDAPLLKRVNDVLVAAKKGDGVVADVTVTALDGSGKNSDKKNTDAQAIDPASVDSNLVLAAETLSTTVSGQKQAARDKWGSVASLPPSPGAKKALGIADDVTAGIADLFHIDPNLLNNPDIQGLLTKLGIDGDNLGDLGEKFGDLGKALGDLKDAFGDLNTGDANNLLGDADAERLKEQLNSFREKFERSSTTGATAPRYRFAVSSTNSAPHYRQVAFGRSGAVAPLKLPTGETRLGRIGTGSGLFAGDLEQVNAGFTAYLHSLNEKQLPHVKDVGDCAFVGEPDSEFPADKVSDDWISFTDLLWDIHDDYVDLYDPDKQPEDAVVDGNPYASNAKFWDRVADVEETAVAKLVAWSSAVTKQSTPAEKRLAKEIAWHRDQFVALFEASAAGHRKAAQEQAGLPKPETRGEKAQAARHSGLDTVDFIPGFKAFPAMVNRYVDVVKPPNVATRGQFMSSHTADTPDQGTGTSKNDLTS